MASVMGRSAECADGTLVLLEGASHEPRDEPQGSLRATPRRLPIEGEPCEFEQETEESAMTAGRTNGTGATRRSECEDLGLQKSRLHCEKNDQRSERANKDVPGTHKVPLEEEQAVCASGEMKNLDGHKNESSAMAGRVDRVAQVDGWFERVDGDREHPRNRVRGLRDWYGRARVH